VNYEIDFPLDFLLLGATMYLRSAEAIHAGCYLWFW